MEVTAHEAGLRGVGLRLVYAFAWPSIHVPPLEGPGAGALVSHTSHHTDLSRYAGRRVAVIGGGQSALESAALLHEAGAEAQVLVREPRVLWGMRPEPARPWTERVTKPASPLGTGWILAAVCKAPGGVRLMPAASRLLLFRRALGPSGGWWLRDRVEGVVPVRTSCQSPGPRRVSPGCAWRWPHRAGPRP